MLQPEQPAPRLTGFPAIEHALSRLDKTTMKERAMRDLRSGKKTARPHAVKLLQVLEGLDKNDLHPKDLLIQKVPVIPPVYRPFAVAGDTFLPGQSNELYRDLIQYKDFHNQLASEVGEEGVQDTRFNLYKAVRSIYGYDEAVNPKTRSRGVSGFLAQLLGDGNLKNSVFQKRLFSKTQDSISRGVITAAPELGLDEIGIPPDMAWKMYGPYIHRRLIRSGMSNMGALQHVAERSGHALKALTSEMEERPVMYSRAPAWHKYSALAGWPKLTEGTNIQLNSYVSTGLGADFDGDTMNVSLPSLDESVKEAREVLMPSRMLLSGKTPDTIVPTLKHEQVLGLYESKNRPSSAKHKFATEDDAITALEKGDIKYSDEVEIGA